MSFGVKFKQTVICKKIHPVIWDAINTLALLARRFKKNITITSWNDGAHMKNSLHWEDKAVDIRRWGLTANEIETIIYRFNDDPRFDCVLEKNHIHLEYDPQ